MSDTCRVQVYDTGDWRGRACGLPIADQLRELCEPHAREADRRAADIGQVWDKGTTSWVHR